MDSFATKILFSFDYRLFLFIKLVKQRSNSYELSTAFNLMFIALQIILLAISQRTLSLWLLRGLDSNQRPLGYEPNEIPTSLPRITKLNDYSK